jgi:hypothetical protein
MKTEKLNQPLPEGHDTGELGDFTASTRMIPISLLAIVIGVTGAFVRERPRECPRPSRRLCRRY